MRVRVIIESGRPRNHPMFMCACKDICACVYPCMYICTHVYTCKHLKQNFYTHGERESHHRIRDALNELNCPIHI